MSGPALAAGDLHKTYRRGREQVHALRGVDLELRRGELVALLGRSGSGKTTLLNCLLPRCAWRPWPGGHRTRSPSASSSGRP